MKNKLLPQARIDLGMDIPFIKGMDKPVKRCWHFCTDGKNVDYIFSNDPECIAGMNRIYVCSRNFEVIILAFCLMDTHIHFILYGEFDQCLAFVRNYIQRTSVFIKNQRNETHSLMSLPITSQCITNDRYLKTAICYVLKNPISAGLPYNWFDYPWSSWALYFRKSGLWTSPTWCNNTVLSDSKEMSVLEVRTLFHSKDAIADNFKLIGDLVFPGEYTCVNLVEELFHTPKSFSYFMRAGKDSDIEALEGIASKMSIPLRELRQQRDAMIQQLFPGNSLRDLDVKRRLILAKALHRRLYSSVKDICRSCGLVYSEAKGLI